MPGGGGAAGQSAGKSVGAGWGCCAAAWGESQRPRQQRQQRCTTHLQAEATGAGLAPCRHHHLASCRWGVSGVCVRVGGGVTTDREWGCPQHPPPPHTHTGTHPAHPITLTDDALLLPPAVGVVQHVGPPIRLLDGGGVAARVQGDAALLEGGGGGRKGVCEQMKHVMKRHMSHSHPTAPPPSSTHRTPRSSCQHPRGRTCRFSAIAPPTTQGAPTPPPPHPLSTAPTAAPSTQGGAPAGSRPPPPCTPRQTCGRQAGRHSGLIGRTKCQTGRSWEVGVNTQAMPWDSQKQKDRQRMKYGTGRSEELEGKEGGGGCRGQAGR